MIESSDILAIIFCVITLPVLGWLSLRVNQNSIKINTLFNNDTTIQKEMTELFNHFRESTNDMKREFSEMRKEVRSDIAMLNNRLDLFTKAEMEALKNLLK